MTIRNIPKFYKYYYYYCIREKKSKSEDRSCDLKAVVWVVILCLAFWLQPPSCLPLNLIHLP